MCRPKSLVFTKIFKFKEVIFFSLQRFKVWASQVLCGKGKKWILMNEIIKLKEANVANDDEDVCVFE